MKGLPTFILLILLCFSQLLRSQNREFSFTRLSSSEGLSQAHVNDIIKDKNGFMWFATDGGLNKYNGYGFTIYKNNRLDANSVSNNAIAKIKEDENGILWLATGSGLDQFNSKTETFAHYLPGRDISVHDLVLDKKNRIWLGTSEGLFRFDRMTKKFKQYHYTANISNSISNDHIYQLVLNSDGELWIATKEGLNRFKTDTEQFTVFKKGEANAKGLQSNWIRSLYRDHNGNMWIGTIGEGIALFDASNQSFRHYKKIEGNRNSLAHNDVLSFEEDSDQNLWIGTENGGISIFSPQQKQFITIANDPADPQSLSNNSVYSLYRDNIGNMWAGTWSNGVNLLPAVGKKFNRCIQVPGNSNSLSNQYILSIVQNNKTDVWIGTDGGGLNKYNLLTHQYTHFTKEAAGGAVNNNFIISLAVLNNNLLALGNHRGGLDVFNTSRGRVVKHISIVNDMEKGFELSSNCLLKDRSGNLWVGTWGGGVYVYDTALALKRKYLHTNANSINSDFINCFLQDRNGDIWIGTDNGLNKLNQATGEFTYYSHATGNRHSISHNEVADLHEDKSGRIWVASEGGLDMIDKNTNALISFTQQDGLPSSIVQAIQEDRQGILWLSTSNGITAFDPSTKHFKSYTVEDGLQGQEFKNNCSYQNSEGLIFFGGNNGFNYFHPDSIRYNTILPPVFITGLSISNKQAYPSNSGGILTNIIANTNSITISYKQNVIGFQFAALNYLNSAKNQYAYRMEGFDTAWIYCGTRRSATYTNLDPGTYTFKVKASNNDGYWNEQGTSLSVIITPPFWQTWWFKTIGLFVLIALIAGLISLRTHNIKKKKLLLEQQVKMQTAELVNLNEKEKNARIEAEKAKAMAEQANKKLQVTNQKMEQFAYVASHDLKEPLRTITSFIQILQKKYQGKFDEDSNKYLDFIVGSSERMKVLINDLLEYSQTGSKLTLTDINTCDLVATILNDIGAAIKDSGAVVTVDDLPSIKGYATEIKLLFQNLLVNAIKFRKKEGAPQIRITGNDKGDHWEFAISDNGIGIAAAHREKIFNIFQRLHPKSEYEGSGIGLAHCEKVTSLHNGQIWVESEEGKGSTFYFTIGKNL